MAENDLTFLDTWTIEEFKEKMNVSTLKVKRSPKTSKLFFTYGREVGAVASKGIPEPEKAVVSKVLGIEGNEFYLLHEEGEGAPTLATLQD